MEYKEYIVKKLNSVSSSIPVAISTLNRTDKLKALIDSLMNCTCVERVDLRVSVDYPPNSDYIEGFNETCQYLKEFLSYEALPFGGFIFYIHNENLGTVENGAFLSRFVLKDYSYVIYIEDDTILASNAIEYLCKGIDEFSSDESVAFICGISRPMKWNSGGGNIIKLPHVVMSTVACTRKNEKADMKWINRENFEKAFLDDSFMDRLYYTYPFYYWAMLEFELAFINNEDGLLVHEGEPTYTDLSIGIYMVYNNLYSVFPVVSIAKNTGYDGSGARCEDRDRFGFSQIMLDQDDHFDYVYEKPLVCREENMIIDRQEDFCRTARDAKIIRWVMLHLHIHITGTIRRFISLLGDVSWKLFRSHYLKEWKLDRCVK